MISEMTSERFATLEYECSDLMSYTQIQMTLKNSRIANIDTQCLKKLIISIC